MLNVSNCQKYGTETDKKLCCTEKKSDKMRDKCKKVPP
jgi:hypothetical protein